MHRVLLALSGLLALLGCDDASVDIPGPPPPEVVRTDSAEVEIVSGYQYFRLDPRNPKWKKIQEEYEFALSLPNVESADVRLYVVQGDS